MNRQSMIAAAFLSFFAPAIVAQTTNDRPPSAPDYVAMQMQNDMFYGTDDFFGEHQDLAYADRVVPQPKAADATIDTAGPRQTGPAATAQSTPATSSSSSAGTPGSRSDDGSSSSDSSGSGSSNTDSTASTREPADGSGPGAVADIGTADDIGGTVTDAGGGCPT